MQARSLCFLAHGSLPCVICAMDDVQDQQTLGSVGSDPKFAVAWKPPPHVAITILKGINADIGRSGVFLDSRTLLCATRTAESSMLCRTCFMCT
jgi:hypothetical protein